MKDSFKRTTEKQLQEELETLRHVFSMVRVLSTGDIGKKIDDCTERRLSEKSYEVWYRSKPCRNCISYRTLLEKRSFSKLEKTKDGIFQVISDYREVDGKPCVIEMIKEFDIDTVIDVESDELTVDRVSDYFNKTYKDVLTDTFNRRYYEECLEGELISGGVAMIDLDDFKIYNDLFGHAVGDAVLKAVAAEIKRGIRTNDKVVRYGGDEFLLFLPGMSDGVFRHCLNSMCKSVRQIVLDDFPAIKLSISAGYIICENEVIKDAVKRADEYLYLAKKRKDCVISDNVQKVKKIESLPEKDKVLIVDDSSLNREILSSILKSKYDISEADNGRRAIELINQFGSGFSAVLLDLVMPEMDGFAVLDYLDEKGLLDELPVIAITGDDSMDSKRTAFDKGVTDYITRPFDAKIVYRRVNNTVKVNSKQKRLVAEVKRELQNKDKYRLMIVEVLSQIVESPSTDHENNHTGHMIQFSALILERLAAKNCGYEFSEREIFAISTAAALHDIGKAQIDKQILDKKGKLTPEEYEIVKTHTILGEAMLKNVRAFENEPLLKYACEICRYHHERFDGNGYPDGLKGEEIPITAQVVSICDVYDALTSKRPYKSAYSYEQAMAMIKNGECGVFNPLILECLDDCVDKFKDIVNGKK